MGKERKALQDWSSKAIKMPQISLAVMLIQVRKSPHVHCRASDPDIPLHFAPHVECRSWEASVLRNPTERGVGEKTGQHMCGSNIQQTKLSLHGFHCAAPLSKGGKNVHVCKRLGVQDVAPTGNGKGREIENQTCVEAERKHTSVNAIQRRALPWQLAGIANCQGEEHETKCLHRPTHWVQHSHGLCRGPGQFPLGTSVCQVSHQV